MARDCETRTGDGAAATCASCGLAGDPAAMKAELTFTWEPTGGVVCRDADGCCTRRLARDRAENPPAFLRALQGGRADR